MSGEIKIGQWLSLVDYAVQHQTSLSTLRRYIKAGKVQFKLESGRYFLWSVPGSYQRETTQDTTGLNEKVKGLEQDLQKAHQEIVELKTLVALYEEKIPETFTNG